MKTLHCGTYDFKARQVPELFIFIKHLRKKLKLRENFITYLQQYQRTLHILRLKEVADPILYKSM